MPRTQLHGAAALGDVAAIRHILAESPGDAMAADNMGWLPLHCACLSGHTAAVELLLAAEPKAALAASFAGCLPLHWAARKGHTEVDELLLAAAPGAASATSHGGFLPLHEAARCGHGSIAGILLAAAPQTERAKTDRGNTALVLAEMWGHLAAARVLVWCSVARPAELLKELLGVQRHPDADPATQEERDEAVHTLLADLAARHALSPADWALLPTPCPGLARALPAVLARSLVEAAQMVTHLPDTARGRLRALALSLARLQRRLRMELPESIIHRILAAAPLEEEQEVDIAEGSGNEEGSEEDRGSSDEE
eukprot:scaffold8.g1713.t1